MLSIIRLGIAALAGWGASDVIKGQEQGIPPSTVTKARWWVWLTIAVVAAAAAWVVTAIWGKK